MNHGLEELAKDEEVAEAVSEEKETPKEPIEELKDYLYPVVLVHKIALIIFVIYVAAKIFELVQSFY